MNPCTEEAVTPVFETLKQERFEALQELGRARAALAIRKDAVATLEWKLGLLKEWRSLGFLCF